MLLDVCVHVFQVRHENSGVADGKKRNGCSEGRDNNVTGNFTIAGVDVGQLTEKCDRSQRVDVGLVNRAVVLIKDGDVVSMDIDDGC